MTQEGMLYFSYDHKLTNCGRLMLWVCRCRASVETMVSMNSPLLYFTQGRSSYAEARIHVLPHRFDIIGNYRRRSFSKYGISYYDFELNYYG